MKKVIRMVGVMLLCFLYILSENGVGAKEISIDKEHFSNHFFRAYIRNSFDKNQDGILSEEERAMVTTIDIGESSEFQVVNELPKVASVKGIEYFPNLETLDVSGNQIFVINLKANKRLKVLDVDNNDIFRLNVSQNKELSELYCSNNDLERLDVSKNSRLVRLFCDKNKLKELSLRTNRRLKDLSISNNRVKKVDLTKCSLLENLYCQKNYLKELKIKVCKDLVTLNCSGNRIEKLDLSSNEMLENLYCEDNRLIQGNRFVMRSQLYLAITSKQAKKVRPVKKKASCIL